MLDEGFRPGEVFALRWPHILRNDDGTGLIQIVDGKTKAARRVLPMTPRVHTQLLARFEAAGKPEDGWIFANVSDPDKHITDGLTKGMHRKALDDSGVKDFVPYTLRHTALTRFGEAAGNNVFASRPDCWSGEPQHHKAVRPSTGRGYQQGLRSGPAGGHKTRHIEKQRKKEIKRSEGTGSEVTCCKESIYRLVPGGGIEPPRAEARRILSPLRLPVPPSRHYWKDGT